MTTVADDYLLPNQLDGDLTEILLARRGVSMSEKEAFFNPSYDSLHDPFLLKDMDKAVERILLAIKNNEKILIYSDYDTDGIPGGVVLHDLFERIEYENFSNHIPNRNKDGYGLNMPACEQAVADGTQVLITVDCGITDREETKFLMDNNCDVIITDHHLPEGDVPAAFAVIDHKQSDCNYPDDNLCGAAVAWKLAQGLIIIGREQGIKEFVDLPDGWEKWLLDLVAISTVCDMVPLVGENRTLVHYGMVVLGKTPRPGLQKIMSNARIKPNNINSDDLGFGIGPRINAASRLDDPMIAFRALLNNSESIDSAMELERLNRRRKTMSATIMKSVWGKLGKRDLPEVIVVGDKEWPLGILGLVAGKIADKYNRPAFVWSLHGENFGGSARGGGRNVFELMQASRELFTGFGGHAASGGFTTTAENIHFLEEKLSEKLSEIPKTETEKQQIDAFLSLEEITFSHIKILRQFEPFGIANSKPLFLLQQARVVSMRMFGKSQEHIEMTLGDEQRGIKAVKFYYGEKLKKLPTEGALVDAVVTLGENSYGYNSSLQLMIEDLYL